MISYPVGLFGRLLAHKDFGFDFSFDLKCLPNLCRTWNPIKVHPEPRYGRIGEGAPLPPCTSDLPQNLASRKAVGNLRNDGPDLFDDATLNAPHLSQPVRFTTRL